MRADVSSADPATGRWYALLPASTILVTVVTLVVIATLLAIHRDSPRTLLSAHGFLHSAISQRFSESLATPPENPFFAGEPLGYYWFFHSLGAGVSSLTGLDPLRSFELLICLAIAGMMICATVLARSLYQSAALGALIGFLVLAGANPQAPLLLLYRFLQNGPSALAERPTYLWGIVNAISSRIRYDDVWGMHGPLINFFLNITARPLALCSVVLVLLALRRCLLAATVSRLLFLALTVALSSALSVLVGVAVAGTLTAALVVYRIAARTPFGDMLESGATDGVAMRTGAALLTGVVMASPTFFHLFGGSAGSIAIAPDGIPSVLRETIMLLASCWLTLGFSAIGVRHVFGDDRAFLFVVGTAALGLIAAAILFVLPVGNQDNFFHVALVFLAVTAPSAVVRLDGTPNLQNARNMALVFLPTFLLVLYCYTGRPDIPLGFEGRTLLHLERERGALYGYIRSETAADAIFVIDPDGVDNAMSGNTAELPALTSRMIFTPRPGHYIANYYRDQPRRTRIARGLLAGEALSHRDEDYLTGLGRPIYWVDYHAHVSRNRPSTAETTAPVFQKGQVALYRWTPSSVTPVGSP